MTPLPSLPPKAVWFAEESNGCLIQNATAKSWTAPKANAAGVPQRQYLVRRSRVIELSALAHPPIRHERGAAPETTPE